MIFATIGTQKTQFTRFFRELEELIRSKNITEQVIVQCGYTKYSSPHFISFDFVNEEKFSQYIEEATLVITHAGYGSLFHSIKAGKKVIAVARLKVFGEMIDDHQLELVKKLSTEGYILDGTYSLPEAWEASKNFIPRPYDFEHHIVDELKLYLDSLL